MPSELGSQADQCTHSVRPAPQVRGKLVLVFYLSETAALLPLVAGLSRKLGRHVA